jgi:hypothetical protein
MALKRGHNMTIPPPSKRLKKLLPALVATATAVAVIASAAVAAAPRVTNGTLRASSPAASGAYNYQCWNVGSALIGSGTYSDTFIGSGTYTGE